jgi:general secretion pathway protein G
MKRAFTLVELLIVVIIVAVLAAIAVPKFAQNARLSKEASLRSNLKLMKSAVDRFFADTGHYPQRMSWLNDQPNEVMPTFPVLKLDGTEIPISGTIYQGPYVTDDAGNGSFTSQPNPKGGVFTHTALRIPMDPVSGLPYRCALSNSRFTVSSSANGNDSRGVPFSSY